MDFFDVGGADAADGDLDEQFIRADARDGDGFEAEVVDAAINDGAHGFGYVGHGGNLTTDETQMKHGFFQPPRMSSHRGAEAQRKIIRELRELTRNFSTTDGHGFV